MRLKYLFRWSKKYLVFVLVIILINILVQYLYTNNILLITSVIDYLNTSTITSNIPEFVKNFLLSFSKPILVIISTCILIIIIQLIRSVLNFVINYLRSYTTEKIAFKMRNTLYDKILYYKYEDQTNLDIGDTIQRVTSDIDQSSSFISSRLPDIFSLMSSILIPAYQLYFIDYRLMLVSLVTIPFVGVASIIWYRYVNKVYKKVEESEGRLTTIIQENINQARVVRAFSNEKYEYEKMDEANKDYTNKSYLLGKKEALFWGFADFLIIFQYALTLLVGILLTRNKTIIVSDVMSALLLVNMLVWPIRGLGRIISDYGKTLVSVKRIEELIEKETDKDSSKKITSNINFGNIEFLDVSFKYLTSDSYVLKNISFKINSGMNIAIMGHTGSGKSTLMHLLNNFFSVSSGKILIDGIDINLINKKYLRENIRIILQDTFLFNLKINENIKITDEFITDDNIVLYSKMSHIDEEINKFKDKYDTLIGEKGTTLSGGQKQRVAIARSLITKSSVLVFDDSLSALDMKTDYLIRKELKNNNHTKTKIIITHRTQTAKDCDLILILKDGMILDFDTHQNLLEKCDFYKELYETQSLVGNNK